MFFLQTWNKIVLILATKTILRKHHWYQHYSFHGSRGYEEEEAFGFESLDWSLICWSLLVVIAWFPFHFNPLVGLKPTSPVTTFDLKTLFGPANILLLGSPGYKIFREVRLLENICYQVMRVQTLWMHHNTYIESFEIIFSLKHTHSSYSWPFKLSCVSNTLSFPGSSSFLWCNICILVYTLCCTTLRTCKPTFKWMINTSWCTSQSPTPSSTTPGSWWYSSTTYTCTCFMCWCSWSCWRCSGSRCSPWCTFTCTCTCGFRSASPPFCNRLTLNICWFLICKKTFIILVSWLNFKSKWQNSNIPLVFPFPFLNLIVLQYLN